MRILEDYSKEQIEVKRRLFVRSESKDGYTEGLLDKGDILELVEDGKETLVDPIFISGRVLEEGTKFNIVEAKKKDAKKKEADDEEMDDKKDKEEEPKDDKKKDDSEEKEEGKKKSKKEKIDLLKKVMTLLDEAEGEEEMDDKEKEEKACKTKKKESPIKSNSRISEASTLEKTNDGIKYLKDYSSHLLNKYKSSYNKLIKELEDLIKKDLQDKRSEQLKQMRIDFS